MEKEVEDLQYAVQQDINKEHLERVRLANQPKPAEEAAENYRLDRDDSIAPSGPKGKAGTTNEAATSSIGPKVFFPNLPPRNESGAKVNAAPDDKNARGNPTDWGGWDPEDNPATSHGFTSRGEYEEARRLNTEHRATLAARKLEIEIHIVPFAAAALSQDGGNTPNLSAIPPPATLVSARKSAIRSTSEAGPL